MNQKRAVRAFAAITLLTVLNPLGFCRAESKEVSVTVYNSDLALIRDLRKVSLKQGAGELRFTDVASQIDPTSVHLKSLTSPDKTAVLEQNFEYDLISSDKILEKYLDQDIEVFGKEGKFFSGKLLSAGNDIVLEKKDGGIQSISKAMAQNIEFPRLPQGLITRPTLVWLMQSERAGDQDVELSYLTGGMNWHAEYVAVADKDDKKLDISAWVSVDNRSGAAYENAKLKLIAGDVNRAAAPQPRGAKVRATFALAQDMAEQFQEKAFFEYHLYTMTRPATLKNNQTKQLSLFPAASVNVNKIYQYEGLNDPKKVKVTLEFVNSKQQGLGLPLPAGKVRVYKQDSDKSQEFVGEDRLDHTPKDEKVRIYVGDAFDIMGERKEKENRSLGGRANQQTVEIKIRNHKDSDVEVIVVERFWHDWEITKQSQKFEKKDSRAIEFKVPVKKDGESTVEYTVITRW